jgi:hypothetical protein
VGFGKRLRRRVSKVRRQVTAPVSKALTPIVGKSVANVLANPGGAVVSAIHPATVAIGKVDAAVYGLGSGLVGAKYLSSHRDTVGGTAANLGTAAIQIEKPILGVAGGLVAGGLGSSVAGAIGEGIAPSERPEIPAPNPQDFEDGRGTANAGIASFGGGGADTSTMLIIGAALLILVLALGSK